MKKNKTVVYTDNEGWVDLTKSIEIESPHDVFEDVAETKDSKEEE